MRNTTKNSLILLAMSALVLSGVTTAVADKPGKTYNKILICHVGSKSAPNGDALKVDLISVSKNANHIGNDAHSFLDAKGYLWEDYPPEDGAGDVAADFEEGDVEGIDRGCELLVETLTCPCWNGSTEDELVAVLSPALLDGEFVDNKSCVLTPDRYFAMVWLRDGAGHLRVFNLGAATANEWQCNLQLNFGGPPIHMDSLGATVGANCLMEASVVVPRLPGCSD